MKRMEGGSVRAKNNDGGNLTGRCVIGSVVFFSWWLVVVMNLVDFWRWRNLTGG